MRIDVCYNIEMSLSEISDTYLKEAEQRAKSVISGFKQIQKKTMSLPGGVGKLEAAMEQIQKRIREEENRQEAIRSLREQVSEFERIIEQTEKRVCSKVTQNRNKFYESNPWARPPEKKSEAPVPLWKRAVNYVVEKCEDVKDAVSEAIDYVKDKAIDIVGNVKDGIIKGIDCVGKVGKCIGNFVWEHKEACLKIAGTVAIIAGAAAITALTGGGGAAISGVMLRTAITQGLKQGLKKTVLPAVLGAAKSAGMYVIKNRSFKGIGGAAFDGMANGMFKSAFERYTPIGKKIKGVKNEVWDRVKDIKPVKSVLDTFITVKKTVFGN